MTSIFNKQLKLLTLKSFVKAILKAPCPKRESGKSFDHKRSAAAKQHGTACSLYGIC